MKAHAQSLLEESRESHTEPVKQEIFLEKPYRCLYRTNRRDLLIQEFLPSGTPDGAENKKQGSPPDPAILRKEISSYLFEYLKGFHVPTHYMASRPGAEMLVKFADPIPLGVRVINRPDKKWASRFQMPNDTSLEFPVLEHYLVGKDGSLVWVNESHLYAFNVVKADEYRGINRLASKVNAVLRGLSERRGMILADLNLGFGRYNGQIIATDELSQLTCRFLESSPGRRNGDVSFTPVNTATAGDIQALYSRLRLNA